MKKKYTPSVGLVGLLGLILPAGFAVGIVSAPAYSASTQAQVAPVDDQKLPSEIVQKGTLPIVDVSDSATASAAPIQSGAAAAGGDAVVGEVRNWLALDDAGGFYYRKGFKLKAINDKTEVWVADEARPAPTRGTAVGSSTGTGFLDGDCRNGRTDVTEAQAAYLADQFQNNMLPKESAVFSVAPARDGSKTTLPSPLYNPSGNGQRTVVLVDNVRDTNFYDLNNTKGFSFIAGFFSSQLNTFFDRNVMTIDGFDWLHRTGATPPNDPVAGDNCKSAPARPFAYEGVFAHEYQHLLHSYSDPGEVNWINEGLSDWAESLTGYIDPSIPITQIGFDSHTQCFLGYLGQATAANPNPRAGGPENSLTRWSDQGDGEILCDYGAAYTFMNYVFGQYGTKFMTALHNNPGNGLVGVQEALDAAGDTSTKALDLIHNWALMVTADGFIDSGATLAGDYTAKKLETPALHASIAWNNPESYSSPGAPSNGSDYVRLRDASGNYLKASEITSLSFEGARSLPSSSLKWKTDPNPPQHEGDPALYSGADDKRDEAAVLWMPVGSGDQAVLTFDAYWDLEETWDYGFIQVSDDNAKTYKSVKCTSSRSDTDPQATAEVVKNVPGFTGVSEGWQRQSCDLSAYSGLGREVLVSFRTVNDDATLGNDPSGAARSGLWLDNIKTGDQWIYDGSLEGSWLSVTQTRPVDVDSFFVNIVSLQTKPDGGVSKVTIKRVALTEDFKIAGGEMAQYIDPQADVVAAVITYDDPTETITQYAPYKLTVNGALQPGGGSDVLPPVESANARAKAKK